ncbi:bifunctional 2-polyprenyl-6-hydroxyphenol methylase/3-demethylubiquinol 3-O-methyltransferase UbiG [Variovorax sp. J22R115]|uniref:class I SAM-dependent methyltransferase n=1 Tax=Variovorax sp. J22R115 TaxID=3053509 RepID=UPI0025772718|nr:class I SAM-dependent methyltransferase [Variovorax sp. J22R115]MDM0053706.1 class I SAM-dependent methyltransferase [Variovorax sp. J22R115]
MNHSTLEPSPWIVRWSHLLAPGASVLDVACGSGRHMRWFAERGHPTTGVDRSPEAVASAAPFGQTVLADIESGPWPFAGQGFGGVIVTNYLWRPRMADIVAAVAAGGVLLYETFAAGNETVGKPSRPDFLLQPGELLAACAGLRVVAYEDGFLAAPDRFVQRVAAVRPPDSCASTPSRHPLQPR